MMGKFRVTRPFMLGHERQEVGAVLELDDPRIVSDLMRANQVEPGDDATRDRLKAKPSAEWSEYKEPSGYLGFRD